MDRPGPLTLVLTLLAVDLTLLCTWSPPHTPLATVSVSGVAVENVKVTFFSTMQNGSARVTIMAINWCLLYLVKVPTPVGVHCEYP